MITYSDNEDLAIKIHRFGMQHIGELIFLANLADEIQPKKVLEIGVGGGVLSTLFGIKGAEKIVSVDVFVNDFYDGWHEAEIVDKVHLINGDSSDPAVVEQVRDNYDLILIDGDHTWEGGKADWDNYFSMGGIIGIHDIVRYQNCDPEEDWFPRRFWKLIQILGRTETKEFIRCESGGWGIIYQ